MSTHQMHQVEELCDRILLIHQGRNLLYGQLQDIRRRFAGEAVLVQTVEDLPEIEGIESVTMVNGAARCSLSPGTSSQVLLSRIIERGLTVEKFEIALPALDEIFIRTVREGELAL